MPITGLAVSIHPPPLPLGADKNILPGEKLSTAVDL